jgi:hypothetical protein
MRSKPTELGEAHLTSDSKTGNGVSGANISSIQYRHTEQG